MPVLNPHTAINRDFDIYELMPTHNDMAAMLPRLEFDGDRPGFYLLNVGETHYPYALPDEDPSPVAADLGRPRRVQAARTRRATSRPSRREFFDQTQHARAPRPPDPAPSATSTACSRASSTCCPTNTWVIVTSDHGELFGEDRYFGHGPIMHEKVLEVPFVEGLVP